MGDGGSEQITFVSRDVQLRNLKVGFKPKFSGSKFSIPSHEMIELHFIKEQNSSTQELLDIMKSNLLILHMRKWSLGDHCHKTAWYQRRNENS